MSFPKDVQKQLGNYVYALVDPRDNKIFYVGKASANNRAFDHLKSADESGFRGSKNQKINEIIGAGHTPMIDVIRHGLDESAVFEVEAAVIDTIGIENLTNEVRGHSVIRGRFSSEKAIRTYGSDIIRKSELPFKAIGFFIKNTYFPNIKEIALYDATRQFWKVGSRAEKLDEDGKLLYRYALAIVDSVIVAVYEIEQWYKAGSTMSTRSSSSSDRKEFIGRLISDHSLTNKKLVDDDDVPVAAVQGGFIYLDD
jgi:hypothetical protein